MKELKHQEEQLPLKKGNTRRSWVPGHRHSSSSWTNALQRLQNFTQSTKKDTPKNRSQTEAKDSNIIVSWSKKSCNNKNYVHQYHQQDVAFKETLPKKSLNVIEADQSLIETNENQESPIKFVGKLSDQAQPTSRHKTHNSKESKHIKPPHCITGASGELFYIGKHIGSGGYSRCYLAHTGAGRAYAVKTISKTSDLSRSAVKQIEREIRIHQSLKHSRVLEFRQFIETSSHIFMVLDFCPNNTLQDIINHHKRLRETDACALLYQLVIGLQYLHTNLIHHGDIKTSNILLDQNMRPKIADFGFSLRFKHSMDHRTSLCGTPAYMAPEILRKPPRFGLLSDVWSLGVVGFAMLYGFTAFDAANMKQVYFRITHYDLVFPETNPPISQETIYTIYSMLSYKEEYRPTAKSLAKRSWLVKCYETTCHPVTNKAGNFNDQDFAKSHQNKPDYEKRASLNSSALDKAKRLRSMFAYKTKPKYLTETLGINIGISSQDIRDRNQLIN